MAILKNGIFGRISGKIGSLVASSWKGINYVRTRPEVIKGAPVSPARKAAQEKLTYLSKLLSLFYSYLVIGFKHKAVQQTELNAAFSANYHTAVLGSYPDLSIDYSKLTLSSGRLPLLSSLTWSYGADGVIQVDWTSDPHQPGSYDDQVMLILYSEKRKIVDGFIGRVLRRDHQCSFTPDTRMKGAKVHLYVFVASFSRHLVSNSEYLGAIQL